MKWQFSRKRSAREILQGGEWTCGSCELPHTGMFDLAAWAPDPWPHKEEYQPNAAIRLEGDFLSEDFCVLEGEHFLVRCVVEIPVHGLEQKFGFGCWGSLKRENFEAYVAHFDEGSVASDGPWWSWMCNKSAALGDSEPVACRMFPQAGRQRPVLQVNDRDHPLAIAQEKGIAPEDVLAIYAENGHQIV